MSLFRGFVPLFMTLAWLMPLAGQIPDASSFPIRDASNNPIPFNPFRTQDSFQGPASMGTVSVRELERPLSGKGLELLQKAQKSIANGDVSRGLEQARAAAQYPAAEGYARGILATEYLKTLDLDAAIGELQQATMLLPGNAAMHSNLAYALGLRGRQEEGLKEARMALKLDPGRSKVRLVLGMILLQSGRKEEAKYHLKKAAVELTAARALLAQHFGE
ncbi:MAG: Tetratricopeptide repeat [Acidobacteriota bacterium]